MLFRSKHTKTGTHEQPAPPIYLDPQATEPIQQDLEDMDSRLAELASTARKIQSDLSDVKNLTETMQHMSERLRQLEDDEVYERILRPLFRDLLLFYDDLDKYSVDWSDIQGIGPDEILHTLRKALLHILARHGIRLMSDTTDTFEPSKQKVVGVIKPDLPADGRIHRVLRRGFYCNDQVLRPEEVEIVRHTNKESTT